MGINYELAPDIQKEVNEIASALFPYVKLDSVVCLRSFGSSSRGTIARCHALGKAMQLALNRRGFYVIEVISKRFDKLPLHEKTKTLIHELMHIPKSFGGGFIHHDVVHERNVNIMYEKYLNLKKKKEWLDNFMNVPEGKNGNEEKDKVKNNDSFIRVEKEKKNWWF